MNMDDFFDRLLTVRFTEDRTGVDIIDQTLIPVEMKRIVLKTKEEVWEAIKKLRVRGAPAIGVSAACGLAVVARRIETTDYDEFYKEFKKVKDYLASSSNMFLISSMHFSLFFTATSSILLSAQKRFTAVGLDEAR